MCVYISLSLSINIYIRMRLRFNMPHTFCVMTHDTLLLKLFKIDVVSCYKLFEPLDTLNIFMKLHDYMTTNYKLHDLVFLYI